MVLMDISMPGRSGLEALEDMKAEDANLPVLICSIHQEKEYAVRALKAGAAGYIPKDSDPEEFIAALHKVASGRRYITANLAELLAASVSDNTDGLPHEQLSNREFEVLCALGRGESITDIAHKLSLSVKTVSTYRTRVLEKLGLKGTADIIRYALDHGLAE